MVTGPTSPARRPGIKVKGPPAVAGGPHSRIGVMMTASVALGASHPPTGLGNALDHLPDLAVADRVVAARQIRLGDDPDQLTGRVDDRHPPHLPLGHDALDLFDVRVR